MTAEQPAVPMTVGTGARAALDRLLGVAEMGWLGTRVRRRIIDCVGEPLRGVVHLKEAAVEQSSAAMGLVGRPTRAGTALRVDLADVERIMRRGARWPGRRRRDSNKAGCRR